MRKWSYKMGSWFKLKIL